MIRAAVGNSVRMIAMADVVYFEAWTNTSTSSAATAKR
jgi:hypothetical protein